MNTPRYQCHKKLIEKPARAEVHGLSDLEAGVKADIAPEHGGELSSLQVRHGSKWLELLYRANDFSQIQGWRGRAPLLWPAVGRSFTEAQTTHAAKTGEKPSGCRYRISGQEYEIACHGFAMNRAWHVVASEAHLGRASLTCELISDGASREIYPFDFRLRTRYTLEHGQLRIEYRVEAGKANTVAMPFSIGNHISLSFPFTGRTAGGWADGMLRGSPTLEFGLTNLSLLDGSSRPKDFRQGVPLTDPGVCNMVSGGCGRESHIELVQPRVFGVRIAQSVESRWNMDGHRYFVLWGDPEKGFLCPEPWLGAPNSLNTGDGLVRLPPGETFVWSMSLEIIED